MAMIRRTDTTRAYALAFVGSLIYMYIAFSWLSGGINGAMLMGAGSVWIPILFGLGMISSVTLFLLSAAGLTIRHTESLKLGVVLTSWWGGFSLIIGTAPGAWFWGALIGFVLAMIGAGWLELDYKM